MNNPALFPAIVRSGRFAMCAFSIIAILTCSVLPASAQTASTGIVTGTVANGATGEFLRGATVQLENTNLIIVTEGDGSFRLTGLPPGERRLKATYAGLETVIETVTVTAGQATRVDFTLRSDIIRLDKLVVAGSREGQAAAVNQQRVANNFKNVVASDAFGDLVDNNAAELLKRLPGVAMDYNGEDASGFRLRGIDPVNTSFTVDGNNLVNASSAGFSDRATNLRQVTVENIESIEVNKSPTAAQPANSLGGQINFITKSAFTQKGRRIQLNTGLNLNTAAMTLGRSPQGAGHDTRTAFPSLALSYSDVIGKKLGVSVIATYDGRYRYNTIYAPSYSYVPAIATGSAVTPTSPTITNSLSLQEASVATQLTTLAVNLDYRLSPTTTIYSRNSFRSGNNLSTYNHGLSLSPGTQTSGSGASQVPLAGNSTDTMVATNGTISRTSGGSGFTNSNATGQFTLGAKQVLGDFNMDYSAFFGRAYDNGVQTRPNFFSYSLKNVGFTVSGVNSKATPVFVQTSGPDYTDLNNYSGLSGTADARYGVDKQWGGRLDMKRSFTGVNVITTIDAGVLYNKQTRTTTNKQRKWNFTLPAGVGLGQFVDDSTGKDWAARGFSVLPGQSLDQYKLFSYTAQHPEVMVEDLLGYSVPRALNSQKHFEEEIGAGYVMATIKIGRLSVVPGVRYEHTADVGTGPVLNSSLGATITDPVEKLKAQYVRVTRRNSYGDLFPNFQVKYDVTPNLLLRAAFTNTIGRPALSDTIPGDTINTTSQTINQNNTNLKPFFADNFDLGAEYYFSGVGVFSIGAFRKDISDYVQSNTYVLSGAADNGFNGDYAGYTVTSKTNIGTARMEGLEVGYSQALTFLPGLARHLSANATYTVIKRTPPPGIPDLTRVIPAIYNAGLTYNDGRLLVGVAYNLRKKYLTSYNATNKQSTYVRDNDRVDLTVNYKFTSKCTLFFDWRNMLNEKDWTTVYDRTTTYFEGGTSVNVGVRTNF